MTTPALNVDRRLQWKRAKKLPSGQSSVIIVRINKSSASIVHSCLGNILVNVSSPRAAPIITVIFLHVIGGESSLHSHFPPSRTESYDKLPYNSHPYFFGNVLLRQWRCALVAVLAMAVRTSSGVERKSLDGKFA